jgi:hypothetical protein
LRQATYRLTAPAGRIGRKANHAGRFSTGLTIVDQPFGSGHAPLLGFGAMVRASVDSGERILLNGLLYPTGAAIPPGQVAASKGAGLRRIFAKAGARPRASSSQATVS